MRRTIFDTPIVSGVLRTASIISLRVLGWRSEGQPPDIPKYVAIFVPHTSNWDFILVMMFALMFRLKLLWLGKSSLFWGPFGPMFTWLGGLPVDRSRSGNIVSQAIQYFEGTDRLAIGIAPEGTRKKVEQWKMGFYYIASGARVPIVTTFLDYHRKIGGFGPVIMPTGSMEADTNGLRAFYTGIAGKHGAA
ncbi:MAG: acyltransferase [Candidatus Hydrogenedentota bacterium]